MPSISRRSALFGGLALAGAVGGATDAVGIEPQRLVSTRYAFTPPHWPAGLRLKIAIIADIHACEPWMSPARIRAIAEQANACAPDLMLLAGDYNAGHDFVTGPVMPEEWGEALSILHAPLGVYSVLGNHDWWHGPLLSMPRDNAESIRRALRRIGVRVLENTVVRLVKDGQPIWLAGLGDQMGLGSADDFDMRGTDDLGGTLAQIKDPTAPILLLAHEPYIFNSVPDRVSLTMCGHTHGGQVNIPGLIPLARTLMHRHHRGHIYGHIVEGGRHLVISGGLGTSKLPIRFLRPPEIVELELGGPPIGS